MTKRQESKDNRTFNKTINIQGCEYSDEFLKFWNNYGKVGNKQEAWSKWKKLTILDLAELEEKYQSYVDVTNTDGTYPSRKNAQTYLNPTKKYWRDKLPAQRNSEQPRYMRGQNGF